MQAAISDSLEENFLLLPLAFVGDPITLGRGARTFCCRANESG